MAQIGGQIQIAALVVIFWLNLSAIHGEIYNPNKQDVSIKLYYFNKLYYLVQKNAKLSRIDADEECTKFNMDLFEKQDNNKDYEKLLKYLKDQAEDGHEMPSYFWTAEKKIKGTLFSSLGLGFVDVNCSIISTTDYKLQLVPCDQKSSYICQGKAINVDEMHQEEMRMRVADDEYYINPKAKFAFMAAYNECLKRQMSMATWNDLLNNDLIMKFARFISFWTYTPNTEIPPKSCSMQGQNTGLDCNARRAFVCKKMQKFAASFSDQFTMSNPITISFAILGLLIIFVLSAVCIRICMVRRRRNFSYNLDDRVIMKQARH